MSLFSWWMKNSWFIPAAHLHPLCFFFYNYLLLLLTLSSHSPFCASSMQPSFLTTSFCVLALPPYSPLSAPPQVDGVSLQGCSEQRAMEVLRRTGPLVRLRLLRKAVCLSHILPPVPPLQPLRHSHSFHEGNPYRVGLNKIQETGAPGLRDGQHIDSSCWNSALKQTRRRHRVFVHSR